MASGRVPGSLRDQPYSSSGARTQSTPGSFVTVAGSLGLMGPGPAGPGHAARPRPPGHSASPRLVGLTISHGARKDPKNSRKWESYQFEGESIIVLAKTDPDNWSSWSRIAWHAEGGKPIAGYGNGWSIPRSRLKEYRVSATLGGVAAELTVSVGTLVDLDPNGGRTGRPGNTPIRPIGTRRKINLYGTHETDGQGFSDYAVLKVYQNDGGFLRPLTKAPLNAPPPDGPGLPDGCASDICMRGTPLFSPTYYAFRRLMNKERCRITYYTPNPRHQAAFIAAFADGSHIQHTSVEDSSVDVFEFPREAIWSTGSSVPVPVVPAPDSGIFAGDNKVRHFEGES